MDSERQCPQCGGPATPRGGIHRDGFAHRACCSATVTGDTVARLQREREALRAAVRRVYERRAEDLTVGMRLWRGYQDVVAEVAELRSELAANAHATGVQMDQARQEEAEAESLRLQLESCQGALTEVLAEHRETSLALGLSEPVQRRLVEERDAARAEAENLRALLTEALDEWTSAYQCDTMREGDRLAEFEARARAALAGEEE